MPKRLNINAELLMHLLRANVTPDQIAGVFGFARVSLYTNKEAQKVIKAEAEIREAQREAAIKYVQEKLND